MQAHRLAVKKIGTHDNPADVLTKFLKPEIAQKHIESFRCAIESGRTRTGSGPMRLLGRSGSDMDPETQQAQACAVHPNELR